MKDIKELIYAAVEENAVVFQELAGNILQARAYDAIEAMRPEVGASMFGEAKEMEDDEEDEEMEDEEDEEDEDEEDDEKKSVKEALHPNQQKIDVVDDEKIDAKDFAKLRKMKKEEVEGLEERSREELISDIKSLKKTAIRSGVDYPAQNPNKAKTKDLKSFHKTIRSNIKQNYKANNEEVQQIDEVDHPKNQADMLAHIMHQIKVTGHPVATDAQFRATHGKDTTKIASLEPGQDKAQYSVAQGGNVKP